MAIAYLLLPASTFYDQVDKINEIIDYLNAPSSPITTYANLTINPGPLLVGTTVDNGAANTQLRANARSRALDLYGAAAFDDGSAVSPSIAFRNSINTGFYRQGTNSIGVSTSGVNRMTVTAAGLIGIGTQSPSTALHVIGSLTYTGLSINNANSSGYNDLIGTNSVERYYLLGTLPLNNAGNYGAMKLKGTFGFWVNGGRYILDAYFSNRDGFSATTSIRRAEKLSAGSIRPVVYQQTDGTISVYVYCPATSFHIFSCEIHDSIQVSNNPNYITYSSTLPTGTLVYDALTASKDVQYNTNGTLTVTTNVNNNTGGIKVTDSLSSITASVWAGSTGVYFGSETGINVPAIVKSNGTNIVSFSTSSAAFTVPINAPSGTITTLAASTFSAATSISLSDFSVLPTTPATTRVATVTQTDARYLRLAGGTMTGPLILSADPTAALGAATKQYVDNSTSAAIPTYINPIVVFTKEVVPPVRDVGVDDGGGDFTVNNAGVLTVANPSNWRTYSIPSGIPSTAKAILVKCVLRTNNSALAIMARMHSTAPVFVLNHIYALGGGDSIRDQTTTVIPIQVAPGNLLPSYDLILMLANTSNYWDYKVVIVGYQ